YPPSSGTGRGSTKCRSRVVGLSLISDAGETRPDCGTSFAGSCRHVSLEGSGSCHVSERNRLFEPSPVPDRGAGPGPGGGAGLQRHGWSRADPETGGRRGGGGARSRALPGVSAGVFDTGDQALVPEQLCRVELSVGGTGRGGLADDVPRAQGETG